MAGRRKQDRKERLRKQREYQREYNKRIAAARAPDRDEIARDLLHYAITENLRMGRENELWTLADSIIERLVARGYDRRATEMTFSAIVDRYGAGWTFQRRLRHGGQPAQDLEGDADRGR
ncbi:hypothetical protein [Aquibium sp. ELW1220]|uniref:hypothetical protein n=1 Tax=Aquibium sp. ELW1220 TaxID=2976766 RepID=UPI0025B18BE2|nr:hypothetical protein [Aquibium sp. ELW1220]MDN2584319.1 hypothetical protein [Aquibium sp. ELW1220]